MCAFFIFISTAMAQMKDEDWLKAGETKIFIGEYKAATDEILIRVSKPSLRLHYLMGIGYENQQKWPEAIAHFQKAVEIDPNNTQSMIALSYMGLGRSLMASAKYEQAIEMFAIVTKQYYRELASDYPRYPNYQESIDIKIHSIADDAQFFIAECYEKMGQMQKARDEYAKVSRFYPYSAKLSEANRKLASLMAE